jgi:hypothetical protein
MTRGQLGLKSPKIRTPNIEIRNKFEIQKFKNKTKRKHLRKNSDLVGLSDLSSCCPGKKAIAEAKKDREKPP